MKKFSIIIVTYNVEKTIRQTLESITKQTFSNYQLIIIDGGSTDNSLLIIKEYSKYISILISEKDEGIYFAMNKGVICATGEWVIFLNSGDSFYNNFILQNINDLNIQNTDILYGSTQCFNSKKKYIQKPNLITNISKKLPFCHQSSLVKRDLFKYYKFDTKYKIASDYDFFYRIYKENYSFQEIDLCISNYDIEFGISALNFLQLELEISKINGNYNFLHHRIIILLKNFKLIINDKIKFYLKCFQ